MTRYLLIAVIVALASYGLVEGWPLLSGPSIVVETPTPYESFPDGIVTVRGHVTHVATLTLDGAPLLQDEQGGFSTTLTFPQGTSILTFIAADRFGRRVTVTRSLFVPD